MGRRREGPRVDPAMIAGVVAPVGWRRAGSSSPHLRAFAIGLARRPSAQRRVRAHFVVTQGSVFASPYGTTTWLHVACCVYHMVCPKVVSRVTRWVYGTNTQKRRDLEARPQPAPAPKTRVRRRNAVGAVSKLSDEGCSSRIPPSLLGLGVCSPLSRARGTRGTYYRPDIGFPPRSSRHSDRPTASLRDHRGCMLCGRCPRPPVGASALFDRSDGDLVTLRPQFEKEPLRPGPFGPVGARSRRR